MRRARYLHPLVHYEGIFGTKVRAIKRWIAIGRDARPPELPPLDDPPRMKGWWIRHMSHRVPEKILELAKLAPPPGAAPAAAATPPPAAAAPGAPSPGPLFDQAPPSAGAAVPLPASSAAGFAGALQRCRAAEASAGLLYSRLLEQARDEKDDDRRASLTAEAEQARRAWDDLVDRLRAMERDAEKILGASGRMWIADDVVASLEVAHLALRDGVRALLRRVRPKLLGLPPEQHESHWLAEVDALFAGLRANRFTSPPADAGNRAA